MNVLARQASASLTGHRRDAAAFFVLVTLVVTYPLPLHLSSRIATCCDAWLYYWHTWWTGQALLGLRLDQFFTDHIYYPTGTSLSFESLSNSVISAALSPVLGGVVAFNLLYLSSYVLGAFGTYLLVTRLTGDRKAGVVYAFSAVRTQNLQFTNMSAIQWMPFVALWSLKTIDSASVKSGCPVWLRLTSTAFPGSVAAKSPAYLVTLAIVALVLADYWGWPRTFVTSDAQVPRFFKDLAAQKRASRVPGSGVRGRGSGERETTASSLAGKQQAREKEDNGGQGKDGPAGAIAQGGNGR